MLVRGKEHDIHSKIISSQKHIVLYKPPIVLWQSHFAPRFYNVYCNICLLPKKTWSFLLILCLDFTVCKKCYKQWEKMYNKQILCTALWFKFVCFFTRPREETQCWASVVITWATFICYFLIAVILKCFYAAIFWRVWLCFVYAASTYKLKVMCRKTFLTVVSRCCIVLHVGKRKQKLFAAV